MGMKAQDSADDAGGETPSASDRARARWGLDRVRLLADDDTDLARALQRHLRHLPVVTLHDRLLPNGEIAAHLAIAPGGVTVIESAVDLAPPLTVQRLRGIFSAKAELLRDRDAADRTAALVPVRERVALVRMLVGGEVSVAGALCLPDTPGLRPIRPLTVQGTLVGHAKPVAALAARDGDLSDMELASLAEHLHVSCPPALS